MKRIAAATLTAVALMTSATFAADCKPLARYASLKLTTSPDLRQLFVPVEIGGKPLRLQLDTGANVTILNSATADALGLKHHDSPIRMYDLTGKWSEIYVETSFKVGGMFMPKYQFQSSKQFEDPEQPDIVGLLGANFLSVFDLSIDPAGKTLDLVNPDHCPDQVIYWPAKAVAKVPIRATPEGDLIIEIKLDGKPVKAILDTGAASSTLRIHDAERIFNIERGSPDTPSAGVLNGNPNLQTYHHVFKTLEFEGITVNNLDIDLIPDKLSREFTETPTGSHIAVTPEGIAPPMLIGMDILRHTRFYIAYKAKTLYVTAPTEAVPADK